MTCHRWQTRAVWRRAARSGRDQIARVAADQTTGPGWRRFRLDPRPLAGTETGEAARPLHGTASRPVAPSVAACHWRGVWRSFLPPSVAVQSRHPFPVLGAPQPGPTAVAASHPFEGWVLNTPYERRDGVTESGGPFGAGLLPAGTLLLCLLWIKRARISDLQKKKKRIKNFFFRF